MKFTIFNPHTPQIIIITPDQVHQFKKTYSSLFANHNYIKNIPTRCPVAEKKILKRFYRVVTFIYFLHLCPIVYPLKQTTWPFGHNFLNFSEDWLGYPNHALISLFLILRHINIHLFWTAKLKDRRTIWWSF